MLKIIYSLLFLSLMFVSVDTSAQDRGVCGTHDPSLGDRVTHNRRFNTSKVRVGETVFIPIVFHSTGKDNGKSRIKNSLIIRQMEKLNRDYLNSDANIIFYIDTINEVDNTDMYNQTLINGVNIAALNKMKKERDNMGSEALNIFITKTAEHGGNSQGTILGYYTAAEDWILVKKSEINGESTTLTHEGGHFFSLPHTFSGWEFGDAMAYDPAIHGDTVLYTTCPGTSYPVELVDRSNCTVSGDKFCDTPTDFNFGLFNGSFCGFKYAGKVWDKNFDPVVPMINNYMSYFDYPVEGNCPPFVFTTEQVNAVKADVASPERAYLRNDYVPDTTSIIGDIEITSFGEIDTNGFYHTPYYDEVLIEWEPVEGATRYVLDITKGSTYSKSIILYNGETSYLATGIKKNSTYICYIKPFNDGYYFSNDLNFKFKTGETIAAVNTIEQLDEIVISPNPVASNESFSIQLNANSNFNANLTIRDISGKVIIVKTNKHITTGNNDIHINTNRWSRGVYFVSITSEKGQLTKKLIIQ